MPDDASRALERRSFLKATGAAGAAASVGVSTVTAGRDPTNTNPDREVIYHLKASYPFEQGRRKLEEQVDGEIVNTLPELRAVVVDVGGNRRAAMSQLESRAGTMREVVDVEANGSFVPLEVDPEDPQFEQQYAPEQTKVDEVWEESLGSEDVSVAVIDTGTDYEHPDLEARFDQSNPGIAPGSGTDDPSDTGKHGTHVAGIVGATTDNETGVSGMTNCQLYAVQALGGRGAFDNVAEGIRWAADQGVDLINMSLGDPRGNQPTVVQEAAKYARDKGVLLLASAGNEGQPDSVLYPAGFEECMAVSALNSDEDIAQFSSRGPAVEITGPGAQVLSTVPGGDYEELSGTSMSCPAVVGTAALAKSFNTEISNTELRAAMKETARDVGLSENEQGAGAIDATALVEQIRDGSEPDPDPDPDPEPEPEEPTAVIDVSPTDPEVGETVTLDGTGSSSPNGEIVEYQWESPRGTATGETVQLSRDSETDVQITLTITDAEDQTASSQATISFGDSGSDCGGTVEESSVTGSFVSWDTSNVYTYPVATENPCQLELDLNGPENADFDLYATVDGRTPTPDDFDRKSEGPGGSEAILLSEVESGQQIGVRVEATDGFGEYELAVEEIGF
jgi:serine protease